MCLPEHADPVHFRTVVVLGGLDSSATSSVLDTEWATHGVSEWVTESETAVLFIHAKPIRMFADEK